jgi:hypothetical protein
VIEQLAAATDTQLLDENVRLDAEIARLRYRQLEVQAELNSRNVAGALGYRGLTQLLQAQLRYTRSRRASGRWRSSGSAPGVA